ncbi:hypothetical protein F511_01393 [Dorcoceras hygrometricum]|uniref:Uncharacterized protein n=1 Tax=Dorcoceras hygrometricum TaxID=472368 RepID=A0A2Z7BEU5_9LAMI|nr:hypothetical protein F511_01393 [Dorcoceras hygrometricum]
MSKETRRKFCNMAHVGRWIETIYPKCSNQKVPEFGKNFVQDMTGSILQKQAEVEGYPLEDLIITTLITTQYDSKQLQELLALLQQKQTRDLFWKYKFQL